MQFFWIVHIKRNSLEFESLNLGSHLFFYEFWKFTDPTKLAETFSIKKMCHGPDPNQTRAKLALAGPVHSGARRRGQTARQAGSASHWPGGPKG
jgi:hypothetical protein